MITCRPAVLFVLALVSSFALVRGQSAVTTTNAAGATLIISEDINGLPILTQVKKEEKPPSLPLEWNLIHEGV
jgi:hypothetical protein